jgi:aminoglycoside 6'-N-acetyltransferase
VGNFGNWNEEISPLLFQWMNNDEVKRWYTKGSINLARIEEKYLPCVKGTSPKLTMIAIFDEEAIGFLQAYSISDYLAYATQVGIGDSVGIDLFIGDSDRINKGLGSEMLNVFVEEVLSTYFSESIAVIGPEPENKGVIRAYEKAGFLFSHQIENPREEIHEYLMKRKIAKKREISVDRNDPIEI